VSRLDALRRIADAAAVGTNTPFLALRAVRHKLRAMAALGTLWPAVRRGGSLLARGRFRQFAGKLFNEREAVRVAESAPVRNGPPLVLAGHILRPGGYDHVVLAMLTGLIEAGANVIRDPDSVIRPEHIPEHARPGEGATSTMPRLIATPPHLLHRFHPSEHDTAFTMWETDTLPTRAVSELNRCGRVIVPSEWGAACFRANGVTVPIHVVPLGHDPNVFHPLPPVGSIVFGTAGALDDGGLRKNVQRVIDLFRTAFPTEPGVRLRVKITPASPTVQTHGDPRIDVIDRSLASSELAEWYGSLTAYVNASFGEGFGLHLLEAMACGRPLISTAFGGASAFFDRQVGYEVSHRLIEARNAIYSGHWGDPDDNEMIATMRRVRSNPDEAEKLGRRSAERAARFTWASTASQVMELLHQTCSSRSSAIPVRSFTRSRT
jgi:glycosyltransferase involved in cell wall biosynthesis